METLTALPVCRRALPITTSRPTAFIDLTDRLAAVLADTGLRLGFVVPARHTTTAVVPWLVELDGPQPCEVAVAAAGTGAR